MFSKLINIIAQKNEKVAIFINFVIEKLSENGNQPISLTNEQIIEELPYPVTRRTLSTYKNFIKEYIPILEIEIYKKKLTFYRFTDFQDEEEFRYLLNYSKNRVKGQRAQRPAIVLLQEFRNKKQEEAKIQEKFSQFLQYDPEEEKRQRREFFAKKYNQLLQEFDIMRKEEIKKVRSENFKKSKKYRDFMNSRNSSKPKTNKTT